MWQLIGRVLLGILALILLTLILPSAVQLSYINDEFLVKVRILFFKIKVYPFKEKAEKEKGEKKTKEKDVKKKKITTKGKIYLAKKINAGAKVFLKKAAKHARVQDVKFVCSAWGKNPSDVALMYGGAYAFISAVVAVLQNVLNIKFKTIQVVPDFAAEKPHQVCFSCKIVGTPIAIFAATFLGFRAFKKYRILRFSKEEYNQANSA